MEVINKFKVEKITKFYPSETYTRKSSKLLEDWAIIRILATLQSQNICLWFCDN